MIAFIAEQFFDVLVKSIIDYDNNNTVKYY